MGLEAQESVYDVYPIFNTRSGAIGPHRRKAGRLAASNTGAGVIFYQEGPLKLYRIRNWNDLYENNRSRELKKLDWFCMPNKQDGDGYTTIMENKLGVAILGAFVACAQIASRCDPRGTLLRDSKIPHDSRSLSRMSRVPLEIIDLMLKVCGSTEVNWLETIDIPDMCEIPASGCEIPASGCLEGKGREGKGNILHQPEVDGVLKLEESDFDKFWKAYPRKVGKQEAMKVFNRKKKNMPPIEKILLSIEAQKKSPDWTKDDGQFIPHPSTWLNRGSWDDVVEIVTNGHAVKNLDEWPTDHRFTIDNAPKREQFPTPQAYESINSLYQQWRTKRLAEKQQPPKP